MNKEKEVIVVDTSSKFTSKKKAIVIGNYTFPHTDGKGLTNIMSCKQDAEETAKVLQSLGFNVMLVLNETKKNMKEAIKKFLKSLKTGDISLFYYSGHGVTEHDRQLIATYNTCVEKLKETTFSLNKYLNAISGIKTKADIIILDCCRNQLKKIYGNFRNEVIMKPEKNMAICYGTSKYHISEAGEDTQMSIFTKHFLNAIQKDHDLYDAMMETIENVTKETDDYQIPSISSTLLKRFYFNKDY